MFKHFMDSGVFSETSWPIPIYIFGAPYITFNYLRWQIAKKNYSVFILLILSQQKICNNKATNSIKEVLTFI